MRNQRLAILILFVGILFSACEKRNPIIEIQTTLGNISVELYVDKAPITANNFLSLVKQGAYDGASFYRTVRQANDDNPISIGVVQGGLQYKEQRIEVEPIEHEDTDQTGIRHLSGTISMARMKPGTARSEFFICIDDQPELDIRGRRNPDKAGFAAFGQVVEGMSVVYKIWGSRAAGQNLDPQIRIHKMETK